MNRPANNEQVIGLPFGYGKFNERAESINELRDIGWHPVHLLHWYSYDGKGSGLKPGQPLITEMPGNCSHEELDTMIGRFRRRPCDNWVLQSENAQNFETKYPRYFPFDYLYHDSRTTEEAFNRTIEISVEEFCSVAHLFPLAGVLHAHQGFGYYPLLMRAWQFLSRDHDHRKFALVKMPKFIAERTGAMIKSACIVYHPPLWEANHGSPLNYFVFRNTVAHEIGHLWWDQIGYQDPQLSSLVGSPEKCHQAVSLFSIFLCMFRGSVQRSCLPADQLYQACVDMKFETRWFRDNVDRVCQSILDLECRFPQIVAPSAETSSVSSQEILAADIPLHLTRKEIFAIRSAAERASDAAESLALAPFATIMNLRKLDTTVQLQLAPTPSKRRDIYWESIERRASCSEKPNVVQHWLDYCVDIPIAAGEHMTDDLFLSLGTNLAHIRLHGPRAIDAQNGSPRTSREIASKCTDAERDMARLMALVFYAFRGTRSRKQFPLEVAKALLTLDATGLRDLAYDADDWFRWCTKDPDAPDEAVDYFVGRVEKIIEAENEVRFAFWGENGKEFRSSMKQEVFIRRGFSELKVGSYFKLFGVPNGESFSLLPTYATDQDNEAHAYIFRTSAE